MWGGIWWLTDEILKCASSVATAAPGIRPLWSLPVAPCYVLLRINLFPEEGHILLSEPLEERSSYYSEFSLLPDKNHPEMCHLTHARSRTANDPISIPVTLTPSQRHLSWLPPPCRHGVMAEAYEEVSWLLDPTQSFGGCHRDTKCEAEGCQRWAGLRKKFWGHREPKEPPGIHPSSWGALWSAL